nr:MAG TPA: hypothetical protein [Caudoviricetes sp.]
MIILSICKFFYSSVKLLLCVIVMQIDQFIFKVLKYRSIGALSYGYPALFILYVILSLVQ